MSPPAENVEFAPCSISALMFISLEAMEELIDCTVCLNCAAVSEVRGLNFVGESMVRKPIFASGSCLNLTNGSEDEEEEEDDERALLDL